MAEPQAADPNMPLSDDYLKAHATDREVLPYLNSEERRRLRRLTPNVTRIGADEGSWEDRGIGGMAYRNGEGNDRTRVDNSLLGMPPEMAVTGGLGIARAVAAPAANLAGRAVAGAKATVGQAMPIVKYEATRSLLRQAGLPDWAATIGAAAISGGHEAVKGKAGGVAVETSPVEAAPSVPPPSAATVGTAARPAPTRPPARATPPSGASSAASLTLDSLTPAEKTQAAKWFAQGMNPEDILKNIGISRKLTKGFGTPTPDQAAASVTDRNAHGRWPE